MEKTPNQNLLEEILANFKGKSLEALVSNDLIRKNIIEFADKKIKETILADKNFPRQSQEDKYYMVRSILLMLDKAYQNAKNAPAVRKALVNSFIQNIFLKPKPQVDRFRQEFGQNPPGFLLISPGKLCNLKCFGCYANSSSASAEKLSWDVLNRIIDEKAELWGSYFTVISGGEPLLYQDQGKTMIDLAKAHPDNYFLMYDNSTLIDKEMAQKIAEAGNITPAISVEGFEKDTDARRGPGMHKKIAQAMKNLKEAGVPFGISITATKNNAEAAVSDELMDYYFDECGAVYAWIFQIMPIGRAKGLDLMVSPEQRLAMYRRTQHLIKDRKLFIADFWNSAPVTDGCISAGKPGGYFYVEWNGNITPCVFNPYSPVNINDVYKKGGNLNDVFRDPFFKSIRKWQKEYALDRKPEEMGDLLAPCPVKDHYCVMKSFLDEYRPKPIDPAAQESLEDPDYQKGMDEYGKNVVNVMDPVWQKEYLGKPNE